METDNLQNQSCEIGWIKDIGDFNVVPITNLKSTKLRPIPYIRRKFYKINLLRGEFKVHYADKTYSIKKQGLLFANPSIPYSWLPSGAEHSGVYCIFTPEFFHKFGNINSYSVFQPEGTHVFELNEEQCAEVQMLFDRMLDESKSNYQHKSDLLRNIVFELVHFGTRVTPEITDIKWHKSSAKRVVDDFMELLEKQFQMEHTDEQIKLTSPADYADELSLHVNYLNRVLKQTLGSSTSKIIQERLLREAKIMLHHSTLSISEIAYLLNFKEVTHFSNFFKKREGVTPTAYRSQ